MVDRNHVSIDRSHVVVIYTYQAKYDWHLTKHIPGGVMLS